MIKEEEKLKELTKNQKREIKDKEKECNATLLSEKTELEGYLVQLKLCESEDRHDA